MGGPDLDAADDDFSTAVDLPPTIGGLSRESSGLRGSRPNLGKDGIYLDKDIDRRSKAVTPFSDFGSSREVPVERDIGWNWEGRMNEDAQGKMRSFSEQKVGTVSSEHEMFEEGKHLGVRDLSTGLFSSADRCIRPPESFRARETFEIKRSKIDNGESEDGTTNAGGAVVNKNAQRSVRKSQLDKSVEGREVSHNQVERNASEVAGDGWRRRGSVVRLGSEEAEELLQIDFTKLGGVVYTRLDRVPNQLTACRYEVANVDWGGKDPGPDEVSRYGEALEVKETSMDTVQDMEDILFDTDEGSGARMLQLGTNSAPTPDRPPRDGTIIASTSNRSGSIVQLRHPDVILMEVDWVEVIGAWQQRGGASFGNRTVGVKEYTMYRVRVDRGGREWEIHSRYRDFVVLYNQLLQLFSHKDNVQLPKPWGKVKVEARNVFGSTSPRVVESRSALIQVCLQSLLLAGPPLSTAYPFLRFLFPTEEENPLVANGCQLVQKETADGYFGWLVLCRDFSDKESQLNSPISRGSIAKAREGQNDGDHTLAFGKTIRLVVQIHKKNSIKQQLQAQYYMCAGCYKQLESAVGLFPEFVQKWGWSGPRFCEYSGQLFCSTCHSNETALVPAWVLQRWDFQPRPVSQLAKAYLDSIYDKPMLCVSAVNPYLCARVPILAHVTEMRRNLSKLLACVRCPAHARILAMMGSRRYLLENNDFFALRDLEDLCKGAFAVLPGYMQAMLQKLSIHMSRQCSVCQEIGDVCGGGEWCDDPSDVIFPYQDRGITRCQSCRVLCHTRCFLKCPRCFCRNDQSVDMLKDFVKTGNMLYKRVQPESGLRTGLSSSLQVEGADLPATTSSTVGGSEVNSEGSVFVSFVKENPCFELQSEMGSSVVHNVNDAVSSSLDL